MKFLLSRSMWFIGLCLMITSCNSDEKELFDSNQRDDLKHTLSKNYQPSAHQIEQRANIRELLEQARSGKDQSKALQQFKERNPNIDFGQDAAHLNKYREMVMNVIDPDTYACDDNDNALNPFINASTEDWTFDDLLFYIFEGNYPFYDVVFFQQPDDPQYYGIDGEYTEVLENTLDRLKRFWDIDGSNINMYGMHGTTYADVDRVFAIVELLYPGFPSDENYEYALILNEVFGSKAFDNFNHPLLSFNAFAIRADFLEDNRIAMGDGLMLAYESIGLGDIAPQGILAHEYAHQIQFSNGYFEDESSPEATRRTELMADAYSAYFLAHRHGGGFRKFEVQSFLDVFFTIGDCGFDNNGHHGTYNQRNAAAQWGIEQGLRSWGRVMSSHEFYLRFENALDGLINCDDCLAD